MLATDYWLVVFDAFDDYRKGDVISDAEEITLILKSHKKRCVRKVPVSTFTGA